MARNLEKFRSCFGQIDKQLLQWYPGHMDKGLKKMQQKLKDVDCLIEIHDARVPISGRNPNFQKTLTGIKPHILVMNKKDLIDDKFLPIIKKQLHEQNEHIIFTNSQNDLDLGIKQLFPLAKTIIDSSDRYNRTGLKEYNMMIIGVPNVGKSTIINRLRNRYLHRANAAPVGAVPGITRSVQTRIKISEDPLFYLFDTPGISVPRVENAETWLKLALCAIVQDNLVGETIVADYLLYWLNKQENFSYIKQLNLEGPSDDILTVLVQIAKQNNKFLKTRNVHNEYVIKPDFHSAAKFMIKNFRECRFGKIMLDEDLIS